ncbi:hypothetical protein FA15DRAFT_760378 [Coprinopsis marcescibilis]|uniref:Uncharacterized protein n=1 Tax=Coprinopsis marcescibilis TaxID=230819 RepID=A0A5C3KFS1_COPMA|nr:hypothetical protein FA15DRAFT_760378 [Coprinopsis marcescibilis]
MANQDTNLQMLESATKGFDYLFANDIEGARRHFAGSEDPFHLMGAGTIAFLEAALGMEVVIPLISILLRGVVWAGTATYLPHPGGFPGLSTAFFITHLVTEASRCLALSEAGAKRQIKIQQSSPSASLSTSRFPAGLEWEIVSADAVVLLGLTNALSESYMGYLQYRRPCFIDLKLDGQGVGANKATVAQVAEHTPKAQLQAMIAAGAAIAATVPNVQPAAA